MSEKRPSASDPPDMPAARVHELEQEIAQQKPVDQQTRQEIHDSEVRYRELFESTGDAIMLLGPQGFIECNEATLQLFGYRTHDEFMAKHPSEVSPPYQPDGTDSLTAANARIAEAYRNRNSSFRMAASPLRRHRFHG